MNFVSKDEARKGNFVQSFEDKEDAIRAGESMERILRQRHIKGELVYAWFPAPGLVGKARLNDASFEWDGTYQIFFIPKGQLWHAGKKPRSAAKTTTDMAR